MSTMDKEATERLARLENHFKVYKSDVVTIKESLNEVRMLLGGSELNGNKGFIKLMEAVETKVNIFENDIINLQKDSENIKFWGRFATALLSGGLILLIKETFFK